MRQIRIFVASPSDVREERNACRATLERLRAYFQGMAELEVVDWPTELYEARRSIQDQLPRPGTYDIVVLILWSTMGSSPVTDPETGRVFSSGTRFEIHDALRGSEGKAPLLLVNRCTRRFSIPAEFDHDQLRAAKSGYEEVQRFFATEAAALGIHSVNEFERTTDFVLALEKRMRDSIRSMLASGAREDAARSGVGDQEPYKGLRVFDSSEHVYFFGRSRAVLQVVDALRHQDREGRPFVLVVGRSGVGKSSFVRAGVVPHLVVAKAVPEIDEWHVALFEPSDSTTDLAFGLASALCETECLPELARVMGSVDELAAALRNHPERVVPVLRTVLDGTTPGRERRRVLLLIDPFEEVFTRGSSVQEVEDLCRALRALCESRLVWIVGTVRVDFYARCAEVEHIRVLEQGEGHFILPALTYSELREVVVEPAKRAKFDFEQDEGGMSLADLLLDEAFQHGEPLPILAYALQQIFEASNARVSGRLTFAAYDRLGHVAGILTKRADEARQRAYERIGANKEVAWNDVFGRLVSVDRDGLRVRLYAKADSILAPHSRVLLEELERARLLIADKNDRGERVVTIAHEAMLREWQTLSAWIEHRYTLLRMSTSLAQAAEEWARQGRRADDLTLRDTRLATAEQFVANPEGLPVPVEVAAFVKAHVDRREQERRGARHRLQAVLAVVSCLALGTTIALWNAIESNYATVQASERAVQNAKKSHELADFMLEELKAKLDMGLDRDKKLVKVIADRLMSHYLAPLDPKIDPRAKAEHLGHMTRAARAIGRMEEYVDAISLHERSLAIVQETAEHDGLDLFSELQALIESARFGGQAETTQFEAVQRTDLIVDLGKWRERSGRSVEAEAAYREALALISKMAVPNYELIVQCEVGLARLLKAKGRYVQATDAMTTMRSKLEAMGREGVRHLPDVYDVLAEQLRYSGLDDEALAVYQHYVKTWEADAANRGKVSLDHQVEYGIVLAAKGHYDEAIERMNRAILDPKTAERTLTLPQYRYKLARVLTQANRLQEAEKQVHLSLDALRQAVTVDPKNRSRYAKCLEASAWLEHKLGKHEEAVRQAKELVDYREEGDPRNLQKERVDAWDLYACCLGGARDVVAADLALQKARHLHQELLEREAMEAEKLGLAKPRLQLQYSR